MAEHRPTCPYSPDSPAALNGNAWLECDCPEDYTPPPAVVMATYPAVLDDSEAW